ncbi:MAG: 30S ribosomal protein S12 methylthiotransferase RimO [Planctomycetes bacterium]|nr:30S ribosomal protein S12 methylthiotransferase RimO [Planctomycetota bacterium]
MNEAIRVCVVSLGCARNLVDSEVLLGHVAQEGLAIVREPERADVVVVNTCGFVDAARQESIDTILEVCQLKEEGGLKGVVAVGCLAQRYADDLRQEIPELDAVMGISDYSGVPGVVRRIVNGTADRMIATVDGGRPKAARSDVGRMLLTPRSYAYLRISEGCDHTCSFCAIPSMRGRNRSKPLEVLVEETEALVAQGVAEVVVVAEDSTAWGLDLYGQRRIHELVETLAGVPGVRWLRLMYAYPHTVQPALTRVIREHPHVVPYLDIPVQHVSSAMLKGMRRGVSAEQVQGILWRLRDEVPGIAVRTTFITGFPGETDADQRELREFVERYRFERMGVFTYSHEEGTRAFERTDLVPAELAEERRAELMAIQKRVHVERNAALVGDVLPVLVDGLAPDADHYVGRTHADAPEVDALVILPEHTAAGAELRAGQLVDVEITGFDEYDLIGRVRQPVA